MGTARVQEASAYKNKGSHFKAARACQRRRREKARNSAKNEDVSIPDPDRNTNHSSYEKLVDKDEFFADNQTHELHSHGQSDLKLAMIFIQNTHDWNYDKPYEWEWGLETLTGKTFVKNKLF